LLDINAIAVLSCPPLQLASPEEAEAIRDQVKVLKRACRHRTMLAWKQVQGWVYYVGEGHSSSPCVQLMVP
jgi:hypothetical protein